MVKLVSIHISFVLFVNDKRGELCTNHVVLNVVLLIKYYDTLYYMHICRGRKILTFVCVQIVFLTKFLYSCHHKKGGECWNQGHRHPPQWLLRWF